MVLTDLTRILLPIYQGKYVITTVNEDNIKSASLEVLIEQDKFDGK